MPITVFLRTGNNRAGHDNVNKRSRRMHRGNVVDIVSFATDGGRKEVSSTTLKIIKINVAPGSSIALQWLDMLLPAYHATDVDSEGNPVVIRRRASRIAFSLLGALLRADLLDTTVTHVVTNSGASNFTIKMMAARVSTTGDGIVVGDD